MIINLIVVAVLLGASHFNLDQDAVIIGLAFGLMMILISEVEKIRKALKGGK